MMQSVSEKSHYAKNRWELPHFPAGCGLICCQPVVQLVVHVARPGQRPVFRLTGDGIVPLCFFLLWSLHND